MMLVMRQLTGVLNDYLAQVTRRVGLTPQDALVLGWMAQQQGVSAALLGERVGRPRQSVQRALERYETRGLAERFPSYFRDRTEGWGLTQQGRDIWDQLERGFGEQEQTLTSRGIQLRPFVLGLENLMIELMTARRHMSPVGLIEPPPPPDNEAPDWDP